MPLSISIILPVLNEESRVRLAITRALALNPDELIVVDGGSTDRTAEIARETSATLLTAPRGRASQMNHGVRHSRGDVLLFLQADTWLEPPALDSVRHTLANPRIAGGAFRQRIDAPGFVYRLLERGNAWRAARRGLAYGDQGIFLRRTVFESLGCFPTVDSLEDVFLMRSLRRRGDRLVLLDGPLHITARHWQRRGVLRQTLYNWWLIVATSAPRTSARSANDDE